MNKNIKKNVGKHSTKNAGDNLDKSVEFIFHDSEDKIETKKIIRNKELCESENHKLYAKTSLITKKI